MRYSPTILLAGLLTVSCGPSGEGQSPRTEAPASEVGASAASTSQFTSAVSRIDAEAARIDSVFQPLPLLRPAAEDALTRFGNAQQLARAQEFGVGRLMPAERVERLLAEGALVLLEDSQYWVVRDLDHSQPLAVPGVHALLTAIGTRFQARLATLGVPAYRLEITSVLRTADDQAELRRVNPNAAAGESTHEYGTTVDVLYSAFSAPSEPIVDLSEIESEEMAFALGRYAAVAAERVAGRRSHELKAILGAVLTEMQEEGRVMVTLERLQPVFHMTIAREGG